MSEKERQKRLAKSLMDEFGETYADEAGIRLKDTPAPLFQLLTLSLLLSARIRAEAAVEATAALRKRGWTTPAKLRGSTWAQRVEVLNKNGYARYDESSARMLGETAELLEQRYRDDLRKLRDAADGDGRKIRDRLTEFKGIGPVGASVFLREAQAVWPSVYPYVDERASEAAGKLGLPKTAKSLAPFANGPSGMASLVAALIRADLAGMANREQAAELARLPLESPR